jgi:hypothetical protein
MSVRTDDVAGRGDLAQLRDAQRNPLASRPEPIEVRVDLGPAGAIAEGAAVDVEGRRDPEPLEQRQRRPAGPEVVVEAEKGDLVFGLRESSGPTKRYPAL